MKKQMARRLVLAAALGVALGAGSARAATWDGGGTDDNWSTAGNWSDNADPAGKAIVFDNTDAVGSAGTVNNIVNVSYTVSSLSYANTSGNYHTTQINTDQTLTVNGLISTTSAGVAIKGSSAGTGALAVNSASGTMLGANGLDLSGLGSFTATLSGLNISGGTPADAVIILADTNTLTLDSINIVTGINQQGALLLGRVNTIWSDSININLGAARPGIRMDFNTGLSNPSVTIRNKAGTGRANLSMGIAGGHSGAATMDLTGGTVDLMLGTVDMGHMLQSDNNNPSGTLTFNAGTVDATTMNLGRVSGVDGDGWSATGTGTVNIDGTGTLIAGTINLGIVPDDITTQNANRPIGSINLDGGTLRAQTIQTTGTGTPSTVYDAQPVREINFSSGTIANKAGVDLTITSDITIVLKTAATHTFDVEAGRTATVGATITSDPVSGGITKTGDGTLILNGTNFFTGDVVVSSGKLVANGGLWPMAGPKTGDGSHNIPPIANINTTGLALGQQLHQTANSVTPGYGWPNGAYITAIDPGNNTIKVSVACYGGGTSTLYFRAGSALGTGTLDGGLITIEEEGKLYVLASVMDVAAAQAAIANGTIAPSNLIAESVGSYTRIAFPPPGTLILIR